MKKVLLKFYEKTNLGDDLFIKIITDRYVNQFSTILQDKNEAFDNIPNLKIYRNSFVNFIFRLIGKIRKHSDRWINNLAKRNDILVQIGGSLFMELDGSMEYWRRQKDAYARLKSPYFILGLNFGPYKTREFVDIVEDIFKRAKDVCFRDNTSYELFQHLDTTRVATDIVFSLDTSRYPIKSEKIAIFSIINGDERFGQTITAKYEREIVNMTHKLVRDGYKVVYMSFCKLEGDEIANKRIRDKLDKKLANNVSLYSYDGQLDDALSLLAKSEIVIASRFHATILGLLFNKKVLPMAYSAKTTNILKDLNFDGPVIDINKIEEFDGNKFEFNLKLNTIDQQIQLANLQFQELDKILVRRK